MNKIYVFVPLIAVLVFGGVYYNFNKHYEAQIVAKKHEEALKREAKAKADAELRAKVYAETQALQEKRKKERLDKEAREEAAKKAREEAVTRRDLAYHDKQKLEDQVRRLEKDVKIETEALAKLEEDKQRNTAEKAFLDVYVKKAEANTKSLRDVLNKLAAIEDARAKAEAAAEAKNNS
jgi:colicin import membrane protein